MLGLCDLLFKGDAALLYDSVHKRIFSLPDHYFLYPGHDYMGKCLWN